jgi:hypothetical protein
MERDTSLSAKEKPQRRKQKRANDVYIRYADDFIILRNGTKEQTEALREELSRFLQEQLRLDLSKEKTKITPLNDGFRFLGFWIQRMMGQKGVGVKVTIPPQAIAKLREKIRRMTDRSTHQDAVNTKIQALNQRFGGWCRYYQYTSKARTQFHPLSQLIFWAMAHGLGRKCQLTMPAVMKRFYRGLSLGTAECHLLTHRDFPTRRYTQRFLKPNPYTMQDRRLTREELPHETYWPGDEARPGLADLRPLILERDAYRCQRCGARITPRTAEIDHSRPVRRFKRPVDANVFDNLGTLCSPCHRSKTEFDRQRESGVR